MKKSLLISWISCCDYPLFRRWLQDYGVTFFDEILIYWDVQYRHPFFWAFIQQSLSHLPNVRFIDPVPYDYGTSDWRTTSTNELVKHATGDWLYSIEQDWFCQNWDEFFTACNTSMEKSELFGWWNPTNHPYIHPAFFAIKRDLLEKTSKDFSAHPEIDGSDHFAMISYDAYKLGAIDKYKGDFLPTSFMFHLGGVNQNELNALNPEFEFHRPEVFYIYNYWGRKANIIQDPRHIELSLAIEKKLTPRFPQIDLENNDWVKYFKN